jgi:uncharacterized protein (DUF433 family)
MATNSVSEGPAWPGSHADSIIRVMRIDWSDCPLVEVVPGKVSGVPILKGTRMPADSIVENYESGSPVAEISENFDISEATIRELAFATRQQTDLLP